MTDDYYDPNDYEDPEDRIDRLEAILADQYLREQAAAQAEAEAAAEAEEWEAAQEIDDGELVQIVLTAEAQLGRSMTDRELAYFIADVENTPPGEHIDISPEAGYRDLDDAEGRRQHMADRLHDGQAEEAEEQFVNEVAARGGVETEEE